MSAEKFPFFESYYESIKDLPAEDFKTIMCAVCEHAFNDGDGEDLTGYQKAIYTLIVPTLDRSKKIAEERREAGKTGGAPVGNSNAKNKQTGDYAIDDSSENKQKQTKTSKNKQKQTTDKQKQADKEIGIRNKEKDKGDRREEKDIGVGVKDEEKEREKPPTGEKREAHTRFTPPSVAEVQDYCRERQNSINAQQFVDFYSSKGWKVGSSPMKDWRAAVRTWEQRDSSRTRSARDRPTGQMDAVYGRMDMINGWLQEGKDG